MTLDLILAAIRRIRSENMNDAARERRIAAAIDSLRAELAKMDVRAEQRRAELAALERKLQELPR